MTDEAATAEATEATTKPAPKRYDILAVSQNRAFNVVEQGMKSLINYMQATNLIRVYAEAIASEWTEVYSNVGPSAHELFVKGVYASDEAPFLELAIRSGTRPCDVAYGPETPETCYFWIEVRGALYPELTGRMKNKLKEILATRFDYYVRDHAALPPHAEVPPGEEPEDRKRRGRGGVAARVGTAVEEF